MAPGRIQTTTLVVLACLASGCVEFRKDFSVVRSWADYNTLARPAVFCEHLTHLPPKPAHVDSFRWMYNQPPGKLGGIVHVPTQRVVVPPPANPPPPTSLPPSEPVDPGLLHTKPPPPIVPPEPSRPVSKDAPRVPNPPDEPTDAAPSVETAIAVPVAPKVPQPSSGPSASSSVMKLFPDESDPPPNAE